MIIECCEKDYRAYPALNYSSLKDFDNNRISYYYEKVLGHKEVKAPSDEVKLGAIVDILLLEPERFDEKFVKPVFMKPVGQMGDFVDELWAVSQRFIGEDGKMTETFQTRLEYTWDIFKNKYPDKFKGKDLAFISDNFNKHKDGVSPKEYFINLAATYGRILIDEKLDKKARKIADAVKNGKYTKHVFDASRTILYEKQIAIVGELNGEPVKGLLDLIKIDHSKKLVTGIDLKTTWQSDSFSYNFKKMKYYLQASLYHYLLNQYVIDKGLTDYQVSSEFLFLVCDNNMQYLPHFEKVDEATLKAGMTGFIDGFGIRYKGVSEIIDEINYCKKSGDYYDTKELNDNNGINLIKL